MPNSHSTTDNPKPRVRGDMYLRAEQRRREEEGGSELNGNRTPHADPVYQLEARDTSEPAILAPMVVVVPQMDPAAEPVVVEADPPAPVPTPAVPAVPAPVPTRQTAAAPRAPRHLPKRRTLVPVAALGAVAIAATFGVTLTLSPPKPTELKDSETADRIATGPEASARPSLPAPPAETAPPVTPSAATPVQPPAPAPPRPAVARVARSASAPRAAEGQLRVNSNPPGARVTVNGIGRGQTPLTVTHLSFGNQTVRVTRDGFTSQESVVRVSGDDPEKVLNVTLRARK